jgi:thioredoxin-related protein
MRQFLAAFAVSSLIILLVHGFGRNGIDPNAPQAASTMEMVVFEHPDCRTCPAFRTKVAPRYEAMPQAADAPLRYVDITRTDTDRMGLTSPLTMVPTVVLMKGGREVDRIAGYWGRDNFLKMAEYLLAKAQ